MTSAADLPDRVRSVVGAHHLVRSVELVGSRRRGDAIDLSDWDFAVETTDFDALAPDLPQLVTPLGPLARQWDPLSEDDTCFMLVLPGAVKVDLIFDRPHAPEPPWRLTRETLPAIDHRFWDWTLWLAAKRARGRTELVAAELAKMSRHLLGPMGVSAIPGSIEEAIELYRDALATREAELAVKVDRRIAVEAEAKLGQAA